MSTEYWAHQRALETEVEKLRVERDRLREALASVRDDVLMRGENDGDYNAHVIQTAIDHIAEALGPGSGGE